MRPIKSKIIVREQQQRKDDTPNENGIILLGNSDLNTRIFRATVESIGEMVDYIKVGETLVLDRQTQIVEIEDGLLLINELDVIAVED